LRGSGRRSVAGGAIRSVPREGGNLRVARLGTGAWGDRENGDGDRHSPAEETHAVHRTREATPATTRRVRPSAPAERGSWRRSIATKAQSARNASWERALSRLIRACVLGFAALEVVAMHLYPGGTFWDRTTHGARFWQNFLCDLESPVALNGEPNGLGALFGKAAMLLMVVGLAPFWWIVSGRLGSARNLGSAVRVLGFVSLGGIVAVALMPSSRFGFLHGVAVVVAGAPGLCAAGLAVAGLAAEPRPRIAAILGGMTLVFALVDYVLHMRVMRYGGPGPMVLPLAQKLAVLLLMAWMMVVARPAGPVEK